MITNLYKLISFDETILQYFNSIVDQKSKEHNKKNNLTKNSQVQKKKLLHKCEDCVIKHKIRELKTTNKLENQNIFDNLNHSKKSQKEFYRLRSIKISEPTGETKINSQYIKNKKKLELEMKNLKNYREKVFPIQTNRSLEIFGIDLMLDEDLQLWLIEVNTNPSLDESNKYLERLIPRMLDDAFKLTLDQIYQPPFGRVRMSQRKKKTGEEWLHNIC